MRTAAYARYSSDAQREASLEDQLRNCRAWCAREGWPDPVVYTDAAISGARQDRPGYRLLLAEAHRYDVVLIDDLSRLSRDQSECAQAIKRLRFAGVRLIGVSDGVDTARKSHKADVGLRSLMSELYLDDLADKTHRGLTGRALAGASAGGLPYGYRVADVGRRVIDEAQATIVRRIFAAYIAGDSPRTIAAALNRDGIPSPRGGTWAGSAIHGDARRGIGILVNPLYAGRQIWNRSHWIKHPDSGRRVRQERPPAEWIITDHPELAIVDAGTWAAAQRRLLGCRVTQPGSVRHGGPGRPPRHLLSGILRCAVCGSPLVVVDRYRYGCAAHKHRGDAVCASRLRVPIKPTESALLAGIQRDLLTESAWAHAQRAIAAALKRATPDPTAARQRLASAERTRENILAALRAGIITPSTKAELTAAETAVSAAQAEIDAQRAWQPSQIIPRARERWQRIVATLADAARNVPAARAALRDLLGDAITIAQNDSGDLYAEIAAGQSELKVVAGACSELWLTAPIRIPLQPRMPVRGRKG